MEGDREEEVVRGSSVLQSDWAKILALLGGLVVTLFTIGSWWGETQTELKTIGAAVRRLDQNILDFAQRVNAYEKTVDAHEYRLRALEQRRGSDGKVDQHE